MRARAGGSLHRWKPVEVERGGAAVGVRSNLEKRLAQVRTEMTALRSTVAALDEQVAYTAEIASDASTRATVSSSPLDARERDQSADDSRRTRRERDEAAARLDALAAESDELLDRLATELARART